MTVDAAAPRRPWKHRRALVAALVAAAGFGALGWATMAMPLGSYRGDLPPLAPEERASAERLRASVRALADGIGERNLIEARGLATAEAWIRGQLAGLGHEVERLPYRLHGREVANLEVRLPGTDADAGAIVVGAHYDAVGGVPGADDNASGVAVVLELLRGMEGRSPRHPFHFVLFVNEEPPFFQTEGMGSLVYARALAERGASVAAMIAVETVGYYDDAPGSQHYPLPYSLFYPDTGDFVGFVGDLRSRALVRRSVELFRRHADFPAEGIATFRDTPGVGWSDHWAFWQIGAPALMVTDTAPFRNPNYHRRSDTWDTLDYERMARVTSGLHAVLLGLDADD